MGQRTWRNVDGERIEGTWRHAFIRNGRDYHLTDLIIYADEVVDCWGLVTLDEFEGKLASGWVATTLEEGARASAHDLAAWKLAEPQMGMTPQRLLGEVRDTIDRSSGGRSLEDAFLVSRRGARGICPVIPRCAPYAAPDSARTAMSSNVSSYSSAAVRPPRPQRAPCRHPRSLQQSQNMYQ